jgi:ribonuclease P protein component
VNRFPKRQRIRRSDDFTAIIRSGAYAADDVLVVNVRRIVVSGADNRPLATDVQESRLGITIARKTGPAVVRNRWKRWIREAFRTQRTELPLGIDIIVRPKRGADGDFAAVAKSLGSTVRRAVKKLR